MKIAYPSSILVWILFCEFYVHLCVIIRCLGAPSDSDVFNSLDFFVPVLDFAHQCVFVYFFVCICCVFLFVFVVYQVWFSLTLCLVSCAAVINGGFFSSLHFPNTLPPEREGFPPRAGFICDICEMYFQQQIFHPLQ